MSTKIHRCNRCQRRYRGQQGWNQDFIAGLDVGLVCPQCQTAQEHLGAEVNDVLEPGETWRQLDVGDTTGMGQFITALTATYPNHHRMRNAADRLAAARKDPRAGDLVALMRRIANDMESGDLWDDSSHNIGAACMRCSTPAPTTLEEFTTWRLSLSVDGGQPVGVICPACLSSQN